MERVKKILNHIFIDGLTGMAQGLFATLIVGTIIQQIGTLIGGNIGDMIFLIGKVAAAFTGAGIGVGVAYRRVFNTCKLNKCLQTAEMRYFFVKFYLFFCCMCCIFVI